MKNQSLFSSKDKSKKLKCCLLQFLLGANGQRMVGRKRKHNWGFILTLLHSERPKLYSILAFLSAVGLVVLEANLGYTPS